MYMYMYMYIISYEHISYYTHRGILLSQLYYILSISTIIFEKIFDIFIYVSKSV